MEDMTPFEEGYKSPNAGNGMSSSDIQYKVRISQERILYLYDKMNEMQAEITKLKNAKRSPTSRKRSEKAE